MTATTWVRPVRERFHSITLTFHVQDVNKLIDFLKQAFGAKQTYHGMRLGGSVMHAEVKIGDSSVMTGEPTGELGPMPCSIHLYVEVCDKVYVRTIAAGAASVMKPSDMLTGERCGGVKDPAGNIWWVATHVEDVSQEEAASRFESFLPKEAVTYLSGEKHHYDDSKGIARSDLPLFPIEGLPVVPVLTNHQQCA